VLNFLAKSFFVSGTLFDIDKTLKRYAGSLVR
jgi:hypothetical protein